MMAIKNGTKTSCEDVVLVRDVLGGDTSAYRELYDRYAQLVRAICYDTTRNVADAQDLSQEVFLRAFDQLNNLRCPERYVAWLVTIAKMVCRQWRRKQGRDKHHRMELEARRSSGVGVPSNDGSIQDLHKALLKLPEKERMAIQTFYLLNQSPDQARTVLNLSRPGLYRVLERARNRLKRLMGDYWEDSP